MQFSVYEPCYTAYHLFCFSESPLCCFVKGENCEYFMLSAFSFIFSSTLLSTHVIVIVQYSDYKTIDKRIIVYTALFVSSYTLDMVYLQWVRRPGRDVNLPPSNAQVK